MDKVTSNTFQVMADIWNMEHGKITSLRYNNNIYKVTDGWRPRGQKEPYLVKWLRKTNKQVFTLKEFFMVYPKIGKYPKRVQHVVVDLIEQKKIIQLGKDKFQVVETL